MMARLGDIFTISSGGTPTKNVPSYYEGGSIPWIKTGDLKNKYISNAIEHITEDGLNNSSAKLFPKDTVLVAMYGATIGACSILSYEAATNQACAAFLPCEDVIPEYLFYFLSSKKDQFIKDGIGGAQPNISAGYLKNIKFKLVSLDDQQKVIDKLSKVDALISFRKQQLSKLDELVKSRFIELFGDPITNDKGFPCKEGRSLFAFSSGKFLEEKKRMQEGVPVYGGNGIAWYTDNSLIETPTLVIGRVGAYCGNVRMITEAAWITDNAIYIKEFKTDEFTLRFLHELMCYMNFSQFADFSGQPKITQKPLESLRYIVPPVELQEQFATFVEQTDKSKLEIQQGLGKLETLKKALMQKYFG